MKIVLAAVLLVGMALCTNGIGRVAANGDWLHPLAFVGYILGITALIFAYAGFTGRSLWLVSSEKTAIIALLAIIALKFAVGMLYRTLK